MAARTRSKPVEAAKVLTTYVVLERIADSDSGEAWRPVKTVAAAGKTQAIRSHTGDGAGVLEGTWRAVPVSSWKGGETTRRVTAAAREPVVD